MIAKWSQCGIAYRTVICQRLCISSHRHYDVRRSLRNKPATAAYRRTLAVVTEHMTRTFNDEIPEQDNVDAQTEWLFTQTSTVNARRGAARRRARVLDDRSRSVGSASSRVRSLAHKTDGGWTLFSARRSYVKLASHQFTATARLNQSWCISAAFAWREFNDFTCSSKF